MGHFCRAGTGAVAATPLGTSKYQHGSDIRDPVPMTLCMNGLNVSQDNTTAPNAKYDFGTDANRAWLLADAKRQFDFFRASKRPQGGFYTLGLDGTPSPSVIQEAHANTRMVHSYCLGKFSGLSDCDDMIDHGMAYLWAHQRDAQHGGFVWSVDGEDALHDGRKLAYGQVFVLLAGASAKKAGHPDADRLIDNVTEILETKFWEEDRGLFADEWNRDWTPFSTYRGMNANMHGVEALLTAYEATGRESYLNKAGRILDFFLRQIAPAEYYRLPEHYTQDWVPDRGYSENPMFRPAGTTPGHSFEMGRLLLQYWDLKGRPEDDSVEVAWKVTERALLDAWDEARGGMVYNLKFGGEPDIRSRYWWPVTEAIGVLASFLKLQDDPAKREWYTRLWQFADTNFMDHERGGWYPEIDDNGAPSDTQFSGKPDIYHSIQAVLFPLIPTLAQKDPSVFAGLLAD